MLTNKTKKLIVVSAALVAGLSVMGIGIHHARMMIPPNLPTTAEEALQTIGTPRFQRLPDDRKEEYTEQTHRLLEQLEPQQRHELFEKHRTDENLRRAMGEVRRQAMFRRIQQFSQADPEERIRILDEDIDRQEQRQAQWQQRDRARTSNTQRPDPPSSGPPGRSGRGRGRRRGQFRQHFERMVERGNPQRHALMREYREALRKRREQRGLPTRRP